MFASLIALAGIEQALGFPTGPPASTCGNLVPAGHPVAATSNLPGGFYINSDLLDNDGNYTGGQTYIS